MFPLCHPVLLRGVWTGGLMNDAMSQTEVRNCLLSKLKCIVRAEDFDDRLVLGNNLK